ncbi:MAG: putative sulfate exporter family transporter [Sphingomicrobium sp.]
MATSAPAPRVPFPVLPGLALCVALALAALVLQRIEQALIGRAWLEALVIAILLGTVVRTAWTPSERWRPGVNFSAKFLLEVAVVLLGAALSAQAVAAAGLALILGILAVVAAALAASYGLGRLFGLPRKMAVLIACGNSICGNSAIAAVAPVIGADGKDVASSIAFTAVLGVVVVLMLPLIGMSLALTEQSYGLLAGLTVYAVPQVLAATLPVGALAVQVGTLVKLVRVLMLGPVVLALSLLAPALRDETAEAAGQVTAGNSPRPGRPPLHKLVPWFIIGFILLAGARSFGLIPQALLQPLATVASWLTILAMAALGLGVDMRAVAKAGPRVTLVVTLSLLALAAMALALIHALNFR